MKCTESEENLNRFFDQVNNGHPTIKFTHETSRNNISFLEMVLCQLTYTTNRQIHIRKCPHRVVILNIAPKVFRTAKLSESNASTPMNKLQKKRLAELKYNLKKRGYNNASINHCFNKASGIDRKNLIQYKEKRTNNRVPFVITYHPALSNLSNIVRKHWKRTPIIVQNLQRTTRLGFQETQKFERYLGES